MMHKFAMPSPASRHFPGSMKACGARAARNFWVMAAVLAATTVLSASICSSAAAWSC